MNFFQRLMEQTRLIWSGMTGLRRVLIACITVAVFGLVIGVGYYVGQPEYVVLYSGLAPEDAGAITAKLTASNVPFKLESGGTTIRVPAEVAAQQRIDLALENLPAKGDKGYQLFDSAQIGMTPFVQHVTLQRATQSELAKTIADLGPIASARVHIAQPDATPFVRDQKPATASVLVKLKPGASLNRVITAGIIALVSRSVEGLDPSNVSVVDAATGKTLTEPGSGDTGGLGSSQLEYRRDTENYLASKAERMLEQVLGPGRAIVRVAAEINFNTKSEKRTVFTPEDKVVKMEKLSNRKSTNAAPSPRGVTGAASNIGRVPPGGAAGGQIVTQDEQITTEYAIPESLQVLEDKGGKVERLTVAAMIDLSKGEGGTAPALTQKDAEDIIKQAVGYKLDRDEIKVSNVKLPGPVPPPPEEEEALKTQQRWELYLNMIKSGSVGVAALVILVLGIIAFRWLRAAMKGPTPAAAPEMARESQEALANLYAVAEQDPEVIARILARLLGPGETA